MGVSGQCHAQAAICSWEMIPGTHWIGGWVSLRAGLDTEARAEVPKLWSVPPMWRWWSSGGGELFVWWTYLFWTKYGRKTKYIFDRHL